MHEIRKGYKNWIKDQRRANSLEVDYGMNWRLRTGEKYPIWRVSWIKETGELYAVNLSNLDDFFVIGQFRTQEAVEEYLSGWVDAMWREGLLDFLKNKLLTDNDVPFKM